MTRLLKAVGLVVHVFLAIIVLQKRRAVRRWLRAPEGATGLDRRICATGSARVWHWIALFFLAAFWLVWAVEVPHGYARALHYLRQHARRAGRGAPGH